MILLILSLGFISNVVGWRIKSSPGTNIFGHSFLSMNRKVDDMNVLPLKSFILKQQDNILNKDKDVLPLKSSILKQKHKILNKGKRNDEYSSCHAQGEYIVEEKLKFIPSESVANEIVKCMEERQKRRNDGQGSDKRNNPLLALIGSPGMGKSTFLTHFPESEAYKRYLNGRKSPIVSTVTFANDTATSVGVEAIGLRIIYGAAVSMGLLDAQSYPWEQFHNNFISCWPSTTHEVHYTVDLLQELFGANRPILILVDDISNIADQSLGLLYPSTFHTRVDGVIASKLLYALCGCRDLDVICSSLSPAYMQDLSWCIHRDVDYAFLPGTECRELGKIECQLWADSLIEEIGCDKIPNEIKSLLRNVHLLYSGHPQSIEGMITAFNDPNNSQKWTNLGNLCVNESIVKVLFQLAVDLPLHPSCDISDLEERDIENYLLNTPSQWELGGEIRKFVENGQESDTYLTSNNPVFPRIKAAHELFHDWDNIVTLDELFKRIFDFSLVGQSHEHSITMLDTDLGSHLVNLDWRIQGFVIDCDKNKTSGNNSSNNSSNVNNSLSNKYDHKSFNTNVLILPSSTKNSNGLPTGYDRLLVVKSRKWELLPTHSYLQVKLNLSGDGKDLSTMVGSMLWHCLSDYYYRHRNSTVVIDTRSFLSFFYIVLYVWEGVDEASFLKSVTRDLVKKAAHHTAMTNKLEKALNPTLLPLVRCIAAVKKEEEELVEQESTEVK
eukprot:gene12019-25181_t